MIFYSRRLLIAAALAALCCGTPALAQDFPSQTIRIVVPFATGGTTDVLARLMADGMSRRLGQSVIVDNKGGAGGNIGAAEVARSRPDGHTLLMATPGPLAINQYLYADPGYDAEKQLVGVTNVAVVPNVLMASKASGINSLADLLKRAKEKPGSLNYGSAGIGTTGHLALELLKTMANIEATHVPYRGAALALNDLMTGNIDLLIDNLPTSLPAIGDGRVVALGVTVLKRVPSVSAVPPIADTLPGFDVGSWFGFVAPAGTPKPVLDKIAATVKAVLADAEIREKVEKMGGIPDAGTPEAFDALIKQEQKKFKEIVLKANIKPN
jgi:tripartite-type tricarboxylate transporter receptor subunit TctC